MSAEIYWIIPERLAVGPAPEDLDLKELKAAGISAILNLQEEHEPPRVYDLPREFQWQRAPVRDATASVGWLQESVDLLREWTRAGEAVYVHCRWGIGRSPAVCMAYLIAEENMDPVAAVYAVKEARPQCGLTPGQFEALGRFTVEERVNGRARQQNWLDKFYARTA